MTLFNSTYLWSFLYKSKKIAPIDKILRCRSSTNNNKNDNNNRLPSKLSGWLANPGGTSFYKLIKNIFKKRLMPAFIFMFLRICEDFSYERSSMKSAVRATIICLFPSLGTTQLNKTFVNVHSYYDCRCKFVVYKHFHWLSKVVKTSASNSLRHKKKAVFDRFLRWPFADDGTTQQNIWINLHNYYISRWAGLNACIGNVLTRTLERFLNSWD